MKRTLKVLLGAAALAIIGVSSATAQTGPLLGRELYLFDGGSGTTQNTIRLLAPPADTLAASWTLTLPKNSGGADFILVNTDGAGKSEWQDGLTIFWGVEGNCDPILPWNPNTLTGNYIGHCLNNIDVRSGDQFINFWFNDQLQPRLTLDSNGRMLMLVEDGSEGLVIGGNGPNGPDAGIVLDCAFPPTVGIEVNALATGILMPTCGPLPLVGISLQAQTTGLEIDSSGNTGILISNSLTGINVTGTTHSINATGTVRLNTVAADASATQVLARNASNDVVYRSIAATGTIVTTPTGGTVNYLPLWSPSTTELGTSIISQNVAATLATVTGALTVTGATTMQGTVTVDPADIALDAADTRLLSIDAASGLVGYRTIPANGDVVVSNGPLTVNGAVTTNAAGQLVSTALTNGQVFIGSTGAAPVASTLTAGAGVTITNAAGSITIAVTNPNPAGTVTNSTLRWSGTAWVENLNLLSTAAGNTTNNGTLTLNVANTVLDASDTRILTQDATTGLVGHRTVAATGDIVTAPIAGTTGRITRWTASNQIGDGSLDDNGTGTLSRTGNIAINTGGANVLSTDGGLTVAGASTLNGTVTVDVADVALDAANTRLLSIDAVSGLVGYRTVPANGDIVVSNGPLGNNSAVTTNGTGQLTTTAMSNGQLMVGSTGLAPVFTTLTAGTGVSITNGAGSITIAASGELLPAGPNTTDATLRWDGSDWVQNINLLSTAAGNTTINGTATMNGTVTVDVADIALDAANTRLLSIDGASGLVGYRDVPANGTLVVSNGALANNAAVHTNASGQLVTAALANGQILIGAGAGAPVAGNITSSGSTVTITNGAGTINLEVANPVPAGTQNYTMRYDAGAWVQAGNLLNDGTDVTATGDMNVNVDLTVSENTNLGQEDADITSIWGTLNVNTANTGALNVNINTSALANVTTIGNNTAGNIINLDAPDVSLLPTIPVYTIGSAPGTHSFIGIDLASGQIKRSTFPVSYTNYGLRFDGSELVQTVMTDDGTNVGVQQTGTLTLASNGSAGNVTVGFDDGIENGSGTNTTNLNSELILAPNIPTNNSTNFILVYDDVTGQIAKKDLGAPIQKSKTAQATITGAPPTRVFTISDTFVATGATITVTLQDGTDTNDYTVTLPAANIVNNVSFSVRLSGVMGAGNTKIVHYTITNP